MPVRAEVIDLAQDHPRASDTIVVDTNVWYWLAYGRASQTPTEQSKAYSEFIKKSLAARVSLRFLPFMHAELASIIERDEAAYYSELLGRECKVKEFRALANQRRRVISEVASAWAVVTQMSTIAECTFHAEALRGTIAHFANYPMGGYDVVLVEMMQQCRLAALLTDDRDFIYVPGIQVFTRNPRALREAEQEGRLVARAPP